MFSPFINRDTVQFEEVQVYVLDLLSFTLTVNRGMLMISCWRECSNNTDNLFSLESNGVLMTFRGRTAKHRPLKRTTGVFSWGTVASHSVQEAGLSGQDLQYGDRQLRYCFVAGGEEGN